MIGYKKGIAATYTYLGYFADDMGNYQEALKNYFASLKMYETIRLPNGQVVHKKGIAASYNNIGIVYKEQGNYPKALRNYFISLKIRESIGNKKDIANSYNNIGMVYYYQSNYPDALKNYFASLKIMAAIGNKIGIANSYNNTGLVYLNQNNFFEALKNYQASLKIYEAMDDKKGIANSYNAAAIALLSAATGSDGVVRSGKILAHHTNAYTDSASVTTVTFDNYYVNSRLITGTEIIVNAGKNFANHHIFNVQIQNGNLYSADGVTAYNSIQQREWIEGDNTLLDPLDDIYMITGTGSGTTTNGENYTLVITTPLRVAVDCAWVESGILEYTVPSLPLVTLNYGNGACDYQATALCGGYTTNIVMP